MGNRKDTWATAKALAKLISGDDKCWLKGWTQANFWLPRQEKTEEDRKRLDSYQEAHDAIVARRVAELKAEDYFVKCEDEADFKLPGKTATLAGKPDIVAIRDGDCVVIDAKSGKRRDADAWQVRVYQFALPLVPAFRTWLPATSKLRGEVEYRDGRVPVAPLVEADRKRIGEGVQRLAADAAPEAAPAKWECQFCPINATCASRYDEEKHTGDAREFF